MRLVVDLEANPSMHLNRLSAHLLVKSPGHESISC